MSIAQMWGFTIVFMLAAGAPAAATAAISVIGGGLARACYGAALIEAPPRAQDFQACDAAIEREILRPRDRAATFVNRAVLHLRVRAGQAALSDLDRAKGLAPGIADIEVNRAAALLLLRRPEDAARAADAALAATPSEPWSALYNRAVAREMLGDPGGAYADYNAALSLKPGWQEALDQLARFQVISSVTE
jgi:tetratricopeptide (TPR) repeat protein